MIIFCFKDCSLNQLIQFHGIYIYIGFPTSHSTWHLDLMELGCIVSLFNK